MSSTGVVSLSVVSLASGKVVHSEAIPYAPSDHLVPGCAARSVSEAVLGVFKRKDKSEGFRSVRVYGVHAPVRRFTSAAQAACSWVALERVREPVPCLRSKRPDLTETLQLSPASRYPYVTWERHTGTLIRMWLQPLQAQLLGTY